MQIRISMMDIEDENCECDSPLVKALEKAGVECSYQVIAEIDGIKELELRPCGDYKYYFDHCTNEYVFTQLDRSR